MKFEFLHLLYFEVNFDLYHIVDLHQDAIFQMVSLIEIFLFLYLNW